MLKSYTLQYFFFLFNSLPYREKLRGDVNLQHFALQLCGWGNFYKNQQPDGIRPKNNFKTVTRLTPHLQENPPKTRLTKTNFAHEN